MKRAVPIGTSAEVSFAVQTTHTIDFAREGLVPVLSTPSLLWHLEQAAIRALEPFLGSDELSVGAEIELGHVAPTPLGLTVTCRARVTHVDGPKISFQVEAHDERERIARGTHLRYVLEVDRLARRVRNKSGAS